MKTSNSINLLVKQFRQSATMATMTANNVRDLGSKDMKTLGNSSTRIDLANIADVPYYVESKFILKYSLINIQKKK